MQVSNRSIFPPAPIQAHLLCVPGSTQQIAFVELRAPELRLLAAHHVVLRRCRPTQRRPGTMCSVARASTSTAAMIRRAASAMPAGQSRYGASCHPWRLPIMPLAIIGQPMAFDPVAAELEQRGGEPPLRHRHHAARRAARV